MNDHPGSIPDITAHLIHDKNTSIAVPCIVFNEESVGYDPRWIYWSYEFLLFRPQGLWTRRPAQTGPRGQNLRFPRFDPMILCSFLCRIRWTTLKSHSSIVFKQMMVYEQITFFIKINLKIGSNIDFLIEKSIFRFKKRKKHGKTWGGMGGG